MKDKITQIREEITLKVKRFAMNPDNKDKILLLPLPQGTGKSVTTAKALSENDVKFIWLAGRHKLLENIFRESVVLSHYNVFIFKGREALVDPNNPRGDRMCKNPLLDVLVKYNVMIYPLLCNANKGKCVYKSTCPYLKQMNILNKTKESWAGAYQMMHTNFFKKYPYNVLVFDENPLDGLSKKIEFNYSHLDKLEEIIHKITGNILFKNISSKSIKRGYIAENVSEWYKLILFTIYTLREIIINTPKEGITGKKFIDTFFNNLAIKYPEYEKTLQLYKTEAIIKKHYRKHIYELFESSEPEEYEDFKNIFYDVVRILKICSKYKDVKKDINIPIFVKRHPVQKNEIYVYEVIKKLPEKPVIILDATGDAELYKGIFGREIDEYNPTIDIDSNIIQVTDGLYPRKSLKSDFTRKKLYTATLRLIRYWISKESCEKVFVIIHKVFSTIDNEVKRKNINTINKSLERFFEDNYLDEKHYDISYYENMKGENITELMSNGKLIIIGTPEPNVELFRDFVSIWYEGETPISNEREIDTSQSGKSSSHHFYNRNYNHKDERYEVHLKTKQQHLLEHNIERVRFIEPSPKKQVVLFSCLPISYETEKMTCDELLDKYNLRSLHLKDSLTYNALIFIQGKGKVSLKEFNRKFCHRKAIQQFGDVEQFRKHLISSNLVKMTKEEGKTKPTTFLEVTKGGGGYVQNIKNICAKKV
jgi:hypothetical protein